MRKFHTRKLPAVAGAFGTFVFALSLLAVTQGCAKQPQPTEEQNAPAVQDQKNAADQASEPEAVSSATEDAEPAESSAAEQPAEPDKAADATADEAQPLKLKWHTDLNSALSEAEERNANILVDIYADWCTFCTLLEEKTFSQENVKKEMQKFVLLKLNADNNRRLAAKLGANGLPTSVVLDKSGNVVHSLGGYMPPQQYIAFLKLATELAQQK